MSAFTDFEGAAAELCNIDLCDIDQSNCNPFIAKYAMYCRFCSNRLDLCVNILRNVVKNKSLYWWIAQDDIFIARRALIDAQKMYNRAFFNPKRPNLVIPFSQRMNSHICEKDS
jgi:hypothetical protein